MGKAPEFWWKTGFSLPGVLLSPIGWAYGSIAGRRMLARPKAHSRLPVICIGNFVVGGTGKTPFALRLAARLKDEGYRPGFLLRGYGGSEKGPLLVDLDQHGTAAVGDEAILLANEAPTIVSSDRGAGAKLAEDQPIDLLIMDDGFQNPALAKDLSLVLVDSAVGFGNGRCFPAGPLRAPAKKQILKTDCLVMVGQGDKAEDAMHLAARKGLPILHAKISPLNPNELSDVDLYAFAGIGRPEKFFKSLTDEGLTVAKSRSFPDHHVYTDADARALITDAENEGLQLVTTAKDMARIASANGELFHWLQTRSAVLDVEMKIAEEDRLVGLIREALRNRSFHPT